MGFLFSKLKPTTTTIFQEITTEEPEGACCIYGYCFTVTEGVCVKNHGNYFGDGSNCYEGICDDCEPIPAGECLDGVINEEHGICCEKWCIDEWGKPQCGGVGCGSLPPGGSNCCGGPILESGVLCRDTNGVGPCLITPEELCL